VNIAGIMVEEYQRWVGLICRLVLWHRAVIQWWDEPTLRLSTVSKEVTYPSFVKQRTFTQPHSTVVANFVPGNFGLFRRNPRQPLTEPQGSAEPRLTNTDVEKRKVQIHTYEHLISNMHWRTVWICSKSLFSQW